MPDIHATLSASGAERWLNCPGSIAITRDMPDTTSPHAEEGTLAHAIAELRLRKHFLEPMGKATFTRRMNKLKAKPGFATEMLGHTEDYLDYIVEVANSFKSEPLVLAEEKVDFSGTVPGGFGTADCILIQDSTLYVIDFKYGKGVSVSAEENPQLKLYALGALYKYSWLYNIKNVHLVVFQPRNGGVNEWETSEEALINWATFTVKPIAERAAAGVEEHSSGEWCRFCKAKATCRTRAENDVSVIEYFGGRLPPLLTDDEVGQMLHRVAKLKNYIKAVEEYAESQMLAGKDIPGWKLVEGRKTRAFTDMEEAFKTLSENGVEESLLWKRTPLTLAQIEKDIGKKRFGEIIGNQVIKLPGKPTVAPESDPREVFGKNQAEEYFNN